MVEGEVSGYGVSQGKWVFFDLKDTTVEAKVRCFTTVHQLTIQLEDGMRVLMRAKPNIHAKTGNFSFIPSHIEPRGEGSLKRAFELLKKKLEAEGLFDVSRKRQIPAIPHHVGILSSEGAAGFGDFMRIAKDRLPGVKYTLVNVAVQGVKAEAELVAGLDYLNSYIEPDVIVVIRGGGSIEDLQAFNTESFARAIVRSRAPVVVGVGHERDVTIADFVADVRASTPSNAAERVVPTKESIVSQVQLSLSRMERSTQAHLTSLKNQVTGQLTRGNATITYVIQQTKGRVQQQLAMGQQTLQYHFSSTRQGLNALLGSIEALAPQNVLKRGYSVTLLNGKALRSVAAVVPGSAITTHLSDGTITSTVT
jgi:exodeoxyribonuclease VII large subunit